MIFHKVMLNPVGKVELVYFDDVELIPLDNIKLKPIDNIKLNSKIGVNKII